MNSRLSNMEEHIVLLILEKGFYVYTVCIILVNCELVIYGFDYNEVCSFTSHQNNRFQTACLGPGCL